MSWVKSRSRRCTILTCMYYFHHNRRQVTFVSNCYETKAVPSSACPPTQKKNVHLLLSIENLCM